MQWERGVFALVTVKLLVIFPKLKAPVRLENSLDHFNDPPRRDRAGIHHI